MAVLSSDKTYVTVRPGDTLSQIAADYGNGKTYQQLAAINDIANPDLIYVDQKIYLNDSDSPASGAATGSYKKASITAFGLQSNGNNTLFATWKWGQSHTESYKVLWTYDTGDGVWFTGSNATVTVDKDDPASSRQSTYNIPTNAVQVRFKVKPISEKKSSSGTATYWSAEWSTVKTYNVSDSPPTTPDIPSVSINKYKLTAELDNLTTTGTSIEFQVYKDDTTKFKTGTAKVTATKSASYSCTVDAGSEYKVRCRAVKGSVYSEWSNFSNGVLTIPSVPDGITTIKATSETMVYLEWSEVATATTYDIEYTTKKEYFDGSTQTTTQSDIETTHFSISLETGQEYFFRVRAHNSAGYSAWSDIKSISIGEKPAAPTTWSSTTTAVVGETLNLYWVHNSEDGSSQTYAELELYIGDEKETHTIKNSADEDEVDKTSSYSINTNEYTEGTTIQWRVRTAGVTKVYGEWSVQRAINIYAPPTLELSITDVNGNLLNTIESFPFYAKALAGPNTQAPIGYHLTVTANESYETVDSVGNPKNVNSGDQVYSRYFDTSDPLLVEFSASNIDLANNISYTVSCVVSMNSGLTAESSPDDGKFTVNWIEAEYEPNAEIGIDEETYTATIKPYCGYRISKYYRVQRNNSTTYTITTEVINKVYGNVVRGMKTTTGEQVYYGTTSDGTYLYYCEVEETQIITDMYLSVYRREFDGSFTLLAEELDSSKETCITDPHPALDYARYRIVATSKSTGAVSYFDVPGYEVGGKAVIIQWDEDWSSFDSTEDAELEEPSWSGSLLKLPYNIDVSDDHNSDVALIEYVGRKHPVSYYGTQLGETSTWNLTIPKEDKETLYGLRRLARWMGDVYVREPSGSGYWANISVSFSQKHCNVSIPVTLGLTRVEGGI